MSSTKLMIRKGMVNVQGRNRPCIQVQAAVGDDMKAVLMEHFSNENLFKRSSYSMGLPAGVPLPPPAIAPHLFALIKNDACPEINVKTILAGQLYQGQSLWEVMAFEYIGKRAYDALIEMMACINELQTEVSYCGVNPDIAAFAADTANELAMRGELMPPHANAA